MSRKGYLLTSSHSLDQSVRKLEDIHNDVRARGGEIVFEHVLYVNGLPQGTVLMAEIPDEKDDPST